MTRGIVKPREHLYVSVQLLRNSILAVKAIHLTID